MDDSGKVTRKNKCFPAYDDEVGVKIIREGRRNIFQDHESLITSASSGIPESEERSYRRHSKKVSERAGHTPEQKKELEKHRANLPDYSRFKGPKRTRTGRTDLFDSSPKRASYTVRRGRDEKPQIERTTGYVAARDKRTQEQEQKPAQNPAQNPVQKPAFVPTYVPDSVVPEKKENIISQEELLAGMKKEANSYLLFDNDSSAYRIKQNEDQPSVRRFNVSDTDVKMTRKEYKKIGKSKSVLERSLSGLIEEDQSGPEGYFPK